MSWILHIDTAQETAFTCISKDGECIDVLFNHVQKDHTGFLHPAIAQLLKQNQLEFSALDAIAVTKGPGSYTGIRVGVAAAKGIAFAINKPFIAISNLDLLAREAKNQIPNTDALICPMIDARRMEVFTAVYDASLQLLMPPSSIILDNDSFESLIHEQKIILTGSGAAKCFDLLLHPNFILHQPTALPQAMSLLGHERLESKLTDDLISFEPLYLKEFQNL